MVEAKLLTLREALDLAVSLSNRRSTEIREELRRALLDGAVTAEGRVDRQSFPFPQWEAVGREFWTTMPDWAGDAAVTSSGDRAVEIHVPRVEIERLFHAGVQAVFTPGAQDRPALWRLEGVEKEPTSDRGWLLPDAMREFCPAEYRLWHESAVATTGDREGSSTDLARLGDAFYALRDALRRGELVATGMTAKGGKIADIPASHWRSLAGGSLFEFSMSVLVHAGRRYTDVRVRERRTDGSSIRTEKRCTEWFVGKVNAGRQPASRDAMLEDARREIDPNLAERAFLRIWEKHAPESWKHPGSKKSNRRT